MSAFERYCLVLDRLVATGRLAPEASFEEAEAVAESLVEEERAVAREEEQASC